MQHLCDPCGGVHHDHHRKLSLTRKMKCASCDASGSKSGKRDACTVRSHLHNVASVGTVVTMSI